MKKLVSLLLAISMAITMAAFTNEEKSADVKHVERVIAGIGEVTLEREKYILDAEQLYDALLEVDKDLVENRADLFDARDAYNALLQQEADKVSEAIAALSNINKDEEGDVKIIIKNGEAIADVEAAYEVLPDAAKAMVTNYKDLLFARAEFDVVSNLNEAKERGAAIVEVDGIKFSYAVDEDVWVLVKNRITEEYEPVDVAYRDWNLTFGGVVNLLVSSELPNGWEIISQDGSGFWIASKQNAKVLLRIQGGSIAVIDESCLQYEDPYLILAALANKLIGNDYEHGEYHPSIYAQHRAIWFKSNVYNRETLCVFILVGNDKIVLLQAMGSVEDSSLTKQTVGIAVHYLNNMTITTISEETPPLL